MLQIQGTAGSERCRFSQRLPLHLSELAPVSPDMARSLRDLQNIAHDLRERACTSRPRSSRSTRAPPAGKAFLDMLGMFAEFETSLRRERQLEGIAAAKAKGVYEGRPATIDRAEVGRREVEGLGATEIACKLRIDRASVYRVLARR
jgi:DNA invertase Pin-like site-specific DNA recombinase